MSTEHVPLAGRRVLDQFQRHHDQRHQEVCDGQVEDIVVGDGAHVSISRDRPDDHEVANQRQDDDDDVQHDKADTHRRGLSEVFVLERVYEAPVQSLVDARRRNVLLGRRVAGRGRREEAEVRHEVDRRRRGRQHQEKSVDDITFFDDRHYKCRRTEESRTSAAKMMPCRDR